MSKVIITYINRLFMTFCSFIRRLNNKIWTFIHESVEIYKKMNYNSFIKIKLLWGDYGKRS